MDKEDSPAESNESDSEEAAADQERALAEKEKVNTELEVNPERRSDPFLKRVLLFIFRAMLSSRTGTTTVPLSVTAEGWVQILTTLCSPQTEPPPSSGSKSKWRILLLF